MTHENYTAHTGKTEGNKKEIDGTRRVERLHASRKVRAKNERAHFKGPLTFVSQQGARRHQLETLGLTKASDDERRMTKSRNRLATSGVVRKK